MRKIFFISFVFLFSIAGCSSNTSTETGEIIDVKTVQVDKTDMSLKKREPRETRIDITNKEGYEVGSASLSMVDSFESVEQLVERSEIVIEGEVIFNEYMDYDDIPFTISTVKILDIISEDKDEFTIGDTIKVVQTGGLYVQKDVGGDGKIFTTEEQKEEFKKIEGKTIEITANDAPVIKKSNEVVLFLTDYDGPLGTDLYVAIGDYQGRFIVESDDYIEPQSLQVTSEQGNSDFTMKEIKAEVESAE